MSGYALGGGGNGAGMSVRNFAHDSESGWSKFAPKGPNDESRPLLDCSFRGTLRRYQMQILNDLEADDGQTLHVVAPPGSGKTLVGCLLAAKNGRRAVALSPTTVIQGQWAQTVQGLVKESPNTVKVSTDPKALGDFTCLTYQMLSVVSTDNVFHDLAKEQWLEELQEGGQTEQQARIFLDEVAAGNPKTYSSGLRKRANSLRKEYVGSSPDLIAKILHPNAIKLLDRLIDHGVDTVILDECHHLLDHWALVVSYLKNRLDKKGAKPLLIGLTATLPSLEDGREQEIYTSLLGGVDYEIPVPAVIKEGNLAPSRDLVHVTVPTENELIFIQNHEERLRKEIIAEFGSEIGKQFLLRTLGLPLDKKLRQAESIKRIDASLAENFDFVLSAGKIFSEIYPVDAADLGFEGALLQKCESGDLLKVIGRYGLQELLGKEEHKERWKKLKSVLADFGLHMSDRGMRRTKDPVSDVLAKSDSKYYGVTSILRQELASPDGGRIRAAVVTDFVRHTNKKGDQNGGTGGGAVRAFEIIASDPVTAAMHPVLVTRNHFWVLAADAPIVTERLKHFGVTDAEAIPITEVDKTCEIKSSQTPTGMLDELGALIEEGTIQLIVGTRGILGEGWDCPSVNTLIDLTLAATSSSVQQLRGRTLRLDPAWPDKVAHNWSVVCLVGKTSDASDIGEIGRLVRKHEYLWGVEREDSSSVVTGLDAVFTIENQRKLWLIAQKVASVHPQELNAAAVLPGRDSEYAGWQVGTVSDERIREQVKARPVKPVLQDKKFVSPPTVAAIVLGVMVGLILSFIEVIEYLEPNIESVFDAIVIAGIVVLILFVWSIPKIVRAFRTSARSASIYEKGTLTLANTLSEQTLTGPWNHYDIAAYPVTGLAGITETFVVEVVGGSQNDQKILTGSMRELFGPVESPRFLLEVGRLRGPSDFSFYGLLAALVDAIWKSRGYLPVPRIIGLRRERAESFAANWNRNVGPARLIEVRDHDGKLLVSRVRRLYSGTQEFGGSISSDTQKRQVWS